MQHTSLFTVMRVELCRNQLSICYKRLRRRSARRSHLFHLALWGLFSSQHNAAYNSPEVFVILIAVRASPSPPLTTAGLLSSKKKPLGSPWQWGATEAGELPLNLLLESFTRALPVLSRKPYPAKTSLYDPAMMSLGR